MFKKFLSVLESQTEQNGDRDGKSASAHTGLHQSFWEQGTATLSSCQMNECVAVQRVMCADAEEERHRCRDAAWVVGCFLKPPHEA